MIRKSASYFTIGIMLLLVPFFAFAQSLGSTVAIQSNPEKASIISRSAWGADDSLLFTDNYSHIEDISDTTSSSNSSAANSRILKCLEDQRLYSNEFTAKQTVDTFNGKNLLWKRRYSPYIAQFVIHHTAMEINGDGRTGLEKMRALYEYHAKKLVWGDVGYNFVIDNEGKIYEGRSGGDFVVGGHAYCNNVGTIGIALMGNFEFEKPTNEQIVSLQKLLYFLSNKYGIKADGTVLRRGEKMPTIVGHEDLLSTECPGYFMSSVMTQIRKNVASGSTEKSVSYPIIQKANSVSLAKQRLQERLAKTGKVSAIKELQITGKTSFENRPGGTVTTQITFTALRSYNGKERIATVKRSNSRIGIWVLIDGVEQRVREEIILPKALSVGNSLQMTLKLQLPRDSGTYSVDIGTETITLIAGGRRVRSAITEPTRQIFSTIDRINIQTPEYRRAQAYEKLGISSSSILKNNEVLDFTEENENKNIRIRLGFAGERAEIFTAQSRYVAKRDGDECVLWEDGEIIDRGIVRVGSMGDVSTVANWYKKTNQFRGVLECRILDGELVLINDLPLEDYMSGLAEEPDSEPFEKQKAFAIAARSYAAFYINAKGNNRKFTSMPYDGNDSPASFQLYGGYVFEKNNPLWVKAVKNTFGEVLMKDGKIVKAAYFSSDDGRTRSPEENGWNNFPFSDVFKSKADPWCSGLPLNGHGVGMSGCGAKGQAKEGRSAEYILQYYYPGTEISDWGGLLE